MMQSEDSDTLQIVPDPDKLERYHRQQLSAMLDGELSPDQARFMLRRLQHDTALAGCWERWQVCGDVLRGHHHALLPPDFAQRVSAAISQDPAPSPGRTRRDGARLLRWGGGAALAASVAMAALLVGRQAGVDPGQAAPQPLPAVAAAGSGIADTPAPAHAVPVPAPVEADDMAAAAAAVAAVAAADAGRRTPGSRATVRSADDGSVRVADRSPDAAVPGVGASSGPAQVAVASTAGPANGGTARDSGGVVADSPAVLASAGDGIGADPFRALPMTVASRPWPRASSAMRDGYAVGFGGAFPEAPAWQGAYGPLRSGTVERFGLPAVPAPRLTGATAIGARPVPVETRIDPVSSGEPR